MRDLIRDASVDIRYAVRSLGRRTILATAVLLTCATGAARGQAPATPKRIGPAERPLGAIIASSPPKIAGFLVTGVRELPGGAVLVWGTGAGGLQLLDPPLARLSTVLSAPAPEPPLRGMRPESVTFRGARVQLRAPSLTLLAVIPARGDSSLVALGHTPAFTVIDPRGRIARTIPSTLPEIILMMVASPVGHPGVDASGRVLIEGTSQTPFLIAAESTQRLHQSVARMPPLVQDSSPLLRIDLATNRIETLAQLRSGSVARTSKAYPALHGVSAHTDWVQYSVDDNWGVLSDGTVLIVRALGCRVQRIPATGVERELPPAACDPHILSGDEKRRLVADEQRRIAQRSARDPVAAGRMYLPRVDQMPDAQPPYEPWSAIPDRDGRLWVRRTAPPGASATDAPLYDVFDGNGAIVDRVRLPAQHRLVGFGRGVAYLANMSFGLDRARIN